MVRKAELKDIDGVEKSYIDLMTYEKENIAYTVWEIGVYPTRKTAEKALSEGDLYVIEHDGEICASMIFNQVQPEEYNAINWKYNVKPEEAAVIHLLCVSPTRSGCGFGSEMLRFAAQKGRDMGCKTVRLDTGSQNKPAVALYTKRGFELAGTSNMMIGGAIAHSDHLFFELKI